jgi:acetylornithine/succinyldiaminopimelate/putrescine aminotransferase
MATTTQKTDQAASLLQEAANLFGKGRIDRMRAMGLDRIETGAEGAYVFDAGGNKSLDCIGSAGIYNLGRRHPELLAELAVAMRETDQGNFPLISIEKARLAKALAEFAGGPLECAVFSVTRGEAMDFACKVARGFTGRPGLITVDGGCYGQTGFALSLSQREDRDLYGPLMPETSVIPLNDIAAASRAITAKTAAVILEPVQAENNCREATPEYLKGLTDLCNIHGALLVIDETQTGLGRTGSKFACETSDVTPDILIIGEALGGGIFPIAATMITQRVNSFMNRHPLTHMSTFGGSDIGCRVAVKALDIYARETPWENAARIGKKIAAALAKFVRPGSPLLAVGGRGLLISLDLGTPENALAFCRAAAQNGLLAMPGAVARNTVVLRPSLLLSDAEADELLAVVAKLV